MRGIPIIQPGVISYCDAVFIRHCLNRFSPHPPGCAFLRYAEHTHPPSPGSQTPGTIHPMIPHDPVGVASTHPINQSAPICVICGSRFFFVRALLSQHPSHCPGLLPIEIRARRSPRPAISKPICLRARRAHASERRMCITVGAAPGGRRTYGEYRPPTPPPEGRYF